MAPRTALVVVATSLVLLGALVQAQSASGSGSGSAGTAVTSAAGKELQSTDFASILGMPLCAIIKAQGNAAYTTMSFVKHVGFTTDENGDEQTRNMDFTYSAVDGEGAKRTMKLTVPLLSVVPIPYLRFEMISLDFNVKITSVDQSAQEDVTSRSEETHVSANFWLVKIDTRTKSTSRSQTSSTNKVQREYSTRVHLTARQAERPEGMSRILDKLLAMSTKTLGKKAAASS